MNITDIIAQLLAENIFMVIFGLWFGVACIAGYLIGSFDE